MIFGTLKPSFMTYTGTATISGVTIAGGIATVTCSENHPFTIGSFGFCGIWGVTGLTLINGVHVITEVPNQTSFKFASAGTGSYGGGGEAGWGTPLNYSFIDYTFVEPDNIEHKSAITGVKTNTFLGDYGNFAVDVRLWQETHGSMTPKTKLTNIYVYYHTNVVFFPHNDKWVADVNGLAVPCYLSLMKPYYYKNLITYDACKLTFATNKYHNLSKLLI